MKTPEPTDARHEDLATRISRLFHPGPLVWLLGLTTPKDRFRPGLHMHGLEEHDGDKQARRPTR